MKTLIIGGGLSGLALADQLEAGGADYLLVEARNRFGGRIMTEQHGTARFDMGPAWFWHGQPRIAALIERLDLAVFEQFYDGELTFEDQNGHVQRGQGFSSMQGSMRLAGGLTSLTDALASGLPEDRKRLNAQVTQVMRQADQITATFNDGSTVQADRVVLALPPRVGAELSFTPALPDQAILAMQNIATWMAGQAKAIAVYGKPFWRENGLSGDAMSRRGPMVEIHDASPASGGPYALFGFIGVPPDARADVVQLREHLKAQLVRLFGPKAATPDALFVKDWAYDPNTSTAADKAPLYAHPTYGLPNALRDLWDGSLVLAGTEVAPQFGGYLEGALEAAETAFETLTS